MNRDMVEVEAPARLHFGFLDLNGGIGRSFGSLGMTLDGLSTRLIVERSTQVDAFGPEAERVAGLATRFLEALSLPGGARITVEQAIPAHAGLGSGTQLALAVGVALARLHDVDFGARQVAELLDRGQRSGIGIGAFEQGGFLVDGGRRAGGGLPNLTSRLPFPPHWRVLLLHDPSDRGLHGESERRAFRELPPFPAEVAASLCRTLMMKLLPGLAEQRLREFGEALSEIQAVIGDYFAPAQGGRYTSPAVRAALGWLESQGLPGLGQSSWGPVGFAVLEGETQAVRLQRDLMARFEHLPLRYQIVAGRNAGAALRHHRDARSGNAVRDAIQTRLKTY